ncbi:MAG: PP2C family protein-serine/threonine phosphatase [Candidatus Binataceae bacterium]
MGSSPASAGSSERQFDLALLSDVGTRRENNEDACGHIIETDGSVAFAVADGIGGYEGGEVASAMAIEITLAAYRESPADWDPARRLYRAVQRANIEIHGKALAVPVLRRMGTTLTAVAVEKGMMFAAHVGDCRLYLVRRGRVTQITNDHTMVADRVRMGLMSAREARDHPERSALLRSLGHELIASVDCLAMPLIRHDCLILCSDGLHNAIAERELKSLTRGLGAEAACHVLIEEANRRGAADNVTCAVFRMLAPVGDALAAGWRGRLRAVFGR